MASGAGKRSTEGMLAGRRSHVVTRSVFLAALLLIALLGVAPYVTAGGPRAVNGQGLAMQWDTTAPVVWNADPGALGLLSNTEARALMADAFDVWEAGPAKISFTQGAPLAQDVNANGFAFNNTAHWQNFYRVDADGKSPVIFDDDGSIIDALFGIGARFEILGVAGIDTPIGAPNTITGASIIINGAFYDGIGPPDSPEDVTLQGLKAAMVHEIGHFINLDHSVLNDELGLDDNPGNDVYVPSMFPIAVADDGALATTNPDDERAAEDLYPVDESLQSIEGTVQAGVSYYQGANVVIRKASDPLMTAYSGVSGGLFFPCNPASTCNPCNTVCDPGNPEAKGKFRMRYMPAGTDFRVCVEQIDTRFSEFSGAFIGPLATPPILPGPEECWDLSEENTQADDPDDFGPLNSSLMPEVDIEMNALPSSDPFEPNNTLGTGATLSDLISGQDTAPSVLGAGDLDVFDVPVAEGERVRIDIDAAEMGASLDAVIGFYDDNNTLVALADDSVDPDSHGFSRDPALDLIATFTGTGKLVVSSFPDLDLNGVGGASTGGYWVRVQVTSDSDGDGVADSQDICPNEPRDDIDGDGVCFDSDNCPTHGNPGQHLPAVLNGPIVPGGQVDTASVSSDGTMAVYLAAQDLVNAEELYSVPVLGGTVTKLNVPLASGQNVQAFRISPDSTRVVFRADQDTPGITELYSVPIGGNVPVRISGTMPGFGDVSSFGMSADSARVVYVADEGGDEERSLYSVPIDGSSGRIVLWQAAGPNQVSTFLPFLISPDNQRVVFRADADIDDQFELYSVPITGGVPTQLNAPLAGANTGQYSISPDSSRVVYRADQDTPGVEELYSVPITGGIPVKLNGALASDSVGAFQIAPNGTRVVYTAEQNTPGVVELYSVPISGGASTRLNGNITPTGYGVMNLFAVATDSSYVVYGADQDTPGVEETFSVPLGGGSPVKLSGQGAFGFAIHHRMISPDSTRAVFSASLPPLFGWQLYSSPLEGGPAVQLSTGPTNDFGYMMTPDSSFLAYGTTNALYSVPIQGGRRTLLASGGGFILPQAATPDGAWILTLTDEFTGTTELHRVDPAAGKDPDGDGVLEGCDLCPAVADSAQDDADGNGLGDACQACALDDDTDADDVCDAVDNCPYIANAGQGDFDADGAGDACDADDDNDGLADVVETDTGTFVSADNTGSDPLDPDSDNDGISDAEEVSSGTNPNDTASSDVSVTFGSQIVISTVNTPHSVFAADVDGDGDIDALSASQNGDSIDWYENDGSPSSGWTRRTITAVADGAQSAFAADVDGDGDIDALSASFNDDTIAWYENDGTPDSGPWTAHEISATADGAWSVFAADVDGDGDMDALSASQFDDEIAWYENDGASPPVWTARTITTAALETTSVFAADVDGDGDMDALATSGAEDRIYWYENDGASPPVWTQRTVGTTADGPWAVSAADVDGDGDVDVLSASVFDNKIAWYENDGASPPVWTARTISTAVGVARSVFAADMDADGDIDVLSASELNDTIAWHQSDGGSPPTWTAHTISTLADDARSVFAADVDGDGDLDALSASQVDNKIAWYENRMIHRSASFPAQSVAYTGADNAQSVFAADVDSDGDMDILSASLSDDELAWYENTNGAGAMGPQQVISTAGDGVASVYAKDVDGDGDTDVLSASVTDDEIAWYENTDGQGSFGSQQVISNAADGARAVFAVDIDGDGDVDVLSASLFDNTIAWHENDGTPGGVGDWTERAVTSGADDARSVFAVDIDDDGDMDILSASAGDNTIAWYENNGNSPPGWTPRTISSTALFACSVFAADVDGDGDVDVLSASSSDDRIAWYENNGGSPPSWTTRTISNTADLANSVFAADIDDDGDLDVLSASELDDTIAWYQNNGSSPPGWTEMTVASSANVLTPASVFAADIDGDGRADVLSASQLDDKIAWYENRGGQFTLDTTALAGQPATIMDGSSTALLSIELTSNGRAGDSSVELATLELLVTDAAGTTLSSEEANRLIGRLHLYRDTGSGIFERGIDPLVTSVETLELSPQIIEFAAGDPRVRAGSGESSTFFVVAETDTSASAQSPASFRLMHVTESGSTARDATAGMLLEMEFEANTGTGTISIAADEARPAVTATYPQNHAVGVSLSTTVVLFFSETVDPASAVAGVAMYAGGAKIAASVSVDGPIVTIVPDSPLILDTGYAVLVTEQLRDMDGNPAHSWVGAFETTDIPFSGTVQAGDLEQERLGATLAGSNADDNTGFATAALGDVNGTLESHGIADLIIGAPNVDAGGTDAGKATLIFGAPGLQSNPGAVVGLTYRTATAGDFIGETVAQAGDLNGDAVRDFLIGAPRSDQSFPDAGVVYLVFGDAGLVALAPATLDLDNLALCATPTLCGVKFLGAVAGDLAGASLSWAGDVDGDGHDDVIIGAPGASPGGRAQAGKVYLVYGPLSPGAIALSSVGSTTRGLVFHGESAGDNLGAAVSPWRDGLGDGFDDLLVGAPGAASKDELGSTIADAGYVYAIQGGARPGRLDDTATPGVIEMSRVANGQADEVAGIVFIGTRADGNIGRSVSGSVDIDADGVDDILIAGNGTAFSIPGDDPKTRTGATQTPTTGGGGAQRAGLFDVQRDFGAVMYVTGDSNPLTVGASGDLNEDGPGDFIIGSPLADTGAGLDAGRAYVIFGSPAPGGAQKHLGGVGQTIDGFIIEGAGAGDNLGASVGGGFDLNADGADDGLVGAPFADTAAGTPANAGETYVISPPRPVPHTPFIHPKFFPRLGTGLDQIPPVANEQSAPIP